ncbi:hypothetical protein [Ectobacillus polymachus]|uniref:hypothetical protein n=1 Tax=Ectobacillus polymachus TaxID=1508806 RepID=UPI003A866C6C
MYPYMQPIPFLRSGPVPIEGDTRFLPFFGFPFLAGIAGGLLGGAAIAAFSRPFCCPPYPYPYPYAPYMY